jgi:hypothetical protein
MVDFPELEGDLECDLECDLDGDLECDLECDLEFDGCIISYNVLALGVCLVSSASRKPARI